MASRDDMRKTALLRDLIFKLDRRTPSNVSEPGSKEDGRGPAYPNVDHPNYYHLTPKKA